ncbi:MAG: biosynthetic-type acetolactate synthase large subunit [Steroidobacteraceae bacterium]
MTGAEMIVQILIDEGLDVVFGYSGGAILPTFDAVTRYNDEHGERMRLIVPANEQGATFMAAGYARASGKVGVALVTSGPGATNTVTAVRDCMADSIPIVVICGQIPTHLIGTDGFQEAPVSAIMSGSVKHVFLVTEPEKLEATIRTAFEIARTGRPGPVVIDVPKDVQNWEGPFLGAGVLPLPGYRARLQRQNRLLEESEREAFCNLMLASRRPLIYAGGGVIHAEASQALRAFADTFRIPVATTLMSLGCYDTDSQFSLGMLGMYGTAYANYAVEDCDFLIAIGARFDDRVAGAPKHFAPNATAIAHLDIDPAEIGKLKAADWHYIGPMGPALDALAAGLRSRGFEPSKSNRYAEWHAHIARLKVRHAMNYDRRSRLVQPYAVIEALSRATAGEAIVCTGVGLHQMWAAQYLKFKAPRRWLTSGSMGTMGFGLPVAIGAQYACPRRLVIDVDGDASIRMNIGELETVTTYGLPVKILLFNNYGDGMVRQLQKLFFHGRYSATDKSLHRKNFISAAEADGFPWVRRLEDPREIAATIKEFVTFPGPAFLEVIIDPEAGAYPMIPAGQGVREMITGEWIESRDAHPTRLAPDPQAI